MAVALMGAALVPFGCQPVDRPTSMQFSNASKQYTCLQHPDIVRPAPGSCPICKAPLIPK